MFIAGFGLGVEDVGILLGRLGGASVRVEFIRPVLLPDVSDRVRRGLYETKITISTYSVCRRRLYSSRRRCRAQQPCHVGHGA